MIVSNSTKKPVDNAKKFKAIQAVVYAFNICYDIVKEKKAFHKLNCIKGDEFELISQVLHFLEEELDHPQKVELILSMLLRLFNMPYNPDANAIEPEEFTKSVL